MGLIDRRQFLTLSMGLLLAPSARAFAEPASTKGSYSAEIGIVYDMLALRLQGTIEEKVDRAAGEYRVKAEGTGPGIASRVDSSRFLREGRWARIRSHSWFDIHGRQSTTDISYDWSRQQIEYHARGETFFFRRLRIVDDVVPVVNGMHVDDVMSATLNYSDYRWPVQTGGMYRTFVVRRRRLNDEGPDDIAPSYRAEIVPLELQVAPDRSGRMMALFDLSRFSSWAKPSQPARIVFSPNRRPEFIQSSLILGTFVTIRSNPS
jgi:hypothetical protein